MTTKQTKQKKQIRIQKKNSEKNKKDNTNLLREIGIDLSDELSCIGVVLQTLGDDEITSCVLKNIRDITTKYAGLDIVLFQHHFSKTPSPVLGSILHVDSLTGWENPIISTDLTTCLDLTGYKMNNFYYYVFSIEPMSVDEKKILRSSKINFIFNKKEDMMLAEKELDIKTKSHLIPEFNLQAICKVIAEGKNDKK